MKEEEIRPEKIFSKYLSLAKKDADSYFRNVPFFKIPCPACQETECGFLFRKSGFDYEECPRCHTLFVNPRPPAEIFNRYYMEAPSIRYWATHFYKKTESSRRDLLIKPKARMVREIIQRYHPSVPKNSCIVDIGAGYGIFCEELQSLLPQKTTIIGIEPSRGLQEACRKKGIITVPKFFEEVTTDDLGASKIIAATSFELLEHLSDPDHFLNHTKKVLGKGALLIITTLNWHGFDLQVLRDRSKSIQPPAHLNFFNPGSIEILLKRHGFVVCEISTPGKLDADIAAKQVPDISDSFIKNLLLSGEQTRERFQQFLQASRLSSHMMVVAKKK